MTDEILTREEIERRFPSEWVLLDEIELSKVQEVLRGRVLWHSRDRDEVDQKVHEIRPKVFALYFTGPVPRDQVYLI